MTESPTDVVRYDLRRWRNVMCPESEPDAEIRAIDAVEVEIGGLPPLGERIRALISRVDPLSHYKAFENLDFLLDAIGNLDYPGSPAVDVLWRHGEFDDDRRTQAKAYVTALDAWLAAEELPAAQTAHPEDAELMAKTYKALGEMNDQKRWLAMCLRKTLKEQAYTPWDFIGEYDDAAFVRAVYLSVLHRPPSPDDLAFRVEELSQGKTREAFFLEIMATDEHRRDHLHGVAAHLKQQAPAGE
ncbi:MAG: DUF4214 domain-containing protein [Anaerolineae bacterium]|nr:DUF4214 domain-containing protein [Anaerolineae bacterium]